MHENLRIQQALFGYSDGHHLVASSVELAPQVRQFLADVTDSSGPEKSEGFEVAYTGLIVPQTNYYALFCTWPAPEMPRPGCVWSHVLLIDLADLSRIPELSILRSLCHRPTVSPVLSTYESPLTLDISDESLVRPPPANLEQAAIVLAALYGQPESGVVVLDESSRSWEPVVFAIWSQQWPRLRRGFSFSTGSLGDRRSAGVPFDLQIAPLSSQRLWERGTNPTTVLDPASAKVDPELASWVSAAQDDLSVGPVGVLRKFLFAYGSEVELQRPSFSKLVESFLVQSHSDKEDPGRGLLQLAEAFPQPAEALTLKRDHLANLTQGRNPSALGPALAVTYFLFQAREATAFSRVPVDFGPPVELLWHHKRSEVLGLLGSLPQNERAEAFRKAVAGALVPEDVPTLWREQEESFQSLLSHQPELAMFHAAWAMPEAGQRALWNIVRNTTDDPKLWSRICAAMLGSQCSISEGETVRLAGTSLREGLLFWLKDDRFRLPSYAWREALRAPLAAALQSDSVPNLLLALSSWVLSASQARSITGERADIQELSQHGLNSLPSALVLHTHFWLTALGLRTGGQEGLVLLSRSFFRVYDAVASSQYLGDSWDLIAPILPELFLNLDWDRCKRLRLAMQRWLSNNRGMGAELQNAAPTNEHANLIRSLR